MCIFQLLLFYIFTVLLNVNSSPSDISLNSSHQAAYCITISTHNWVVATHAAFWKSYSLKNLMRLSLPLHCALQCFGKLSRGAHFNSVMSVKYEVKLTASLERCHDDFTLWHGILNSQYLTCRWEKHSLYIFISIMNIIFYILYLLFNERTESENRRYHLAAGKSAHCIPLILSLHIPMLLLQFYLHEH